jgi:hypothetical protein
LRAFDPRNACKRGSCNQSRLSIDHTRNFAKGAVAIQGATSPARLDEVTVLPDRASVERLAHYELARRARYSSGNADGPAAGTDTVDPLEFLTRSPLQSILWPSAPQSTSDPLRLSPRLEVHDGD